MGLKKTYGILPPPPILIGLIRTLERKGRGQWLAAKSVVLGGMKPNWPSTFLPERRAARARSGLAAQRRLSHDSQTP